MMIMLMDMLVYIMMSDYYGDECDGACDDEYDDGGRIRGCVVVDERRSMNGIC